MVEGAFRSTGRFSRRTATRPDWRARRSTPADVVSDATSDAKVSYSSTFGPRRRPTRCPKSQPAATATR
jgi:hypothetical protein